MKVRELPVMEDGSPVLTCKWLLMTAAGSAACSAILKAVDNFSPLGKAGAILTLGYIISVVYLWYWRKL